MDKELLKHYYEEGKKFGYALARGATDLPSVQTFDELYTEQLDKPLVNGCFRKRTFIEVFCKKCGERYNADAEYEAVFNDKAEAIECMEDSGWLVKGRDAFCENCR